MNKSQKGYYDKVSVEEMLDEQPGWFGKTTFDELSQGITRFINPGLIDEVFNKIALYKVFTETSEKIKSKKLLYNSAGLGVFVFDRASMALYRLKEYYSPTHNILVDKKDTYNKGKTSF